MGLIEVIVRNILIMINQLRQMAIFAKTIDHGSFRGAAAELKLSPSVVSHHISELEMQLGVALIYRSTRKLSLTIDGERLLIAARKMLEAVEGELYDISGNSGEPSGELRLTVPSVLSQSSFIDCIAKFIEKYKSIKITLDYSDKSKALIENGFDIAIRMWLEEKKTVTTKSLYKLNRKLVATQAFLDKHPPISHILELQNLEWITLSPVHNKGIYFTDASQNRIKIKPNAQLSSNDVQSIYKLVLKGLGVATLPDFLVEDDIRSGKLVHVLPQYLLDALSVFAEWPTNAPRHGLIKLLVNELAAYYTRVH